MSAVAGGAEPAVRVALDGWVAGWCASRSVAPAQGIDGGWQVDTHTEDEPVRTVLTEPTPSRVAAVVDRELPAGAVLKLPGEPDDWRSLVPDGWERLPDVAFMTLALDALTPGSPALPEPFSLRSQGDDDRHVIVEILDDEGAVAAAGHLGLAGDWAVPDRISTESAHRRRGLGTAVMAALAREAASRGATSLVLGATADGVALYSHLGWTRVASMTSFRLVDPGPGHDGTWRQASVPA